jgi:hypothetical protein
VCDASTADFGYVHAAHLASIQIDNGATGFNGGGARFSGGRLDFSGGQA